MANQDIHTPILVEKHYIPRDVYLSLYRPLTNLSSRTPAVLPQPRVSPFSRMFNTFFPTTTPEPAPGPVHTDDDNINGNTTAGLNSANPDLLSFFSNVTGGTRRVNTSGGSSTSGSYSVRTESRTGPDSIPIIVESASASIPVTGNTGDAFNMLLSALLNTSIGASSGNDSRLTQGQIANNSRLFRFNGSVDLDTTECPICTAEWANNEELRKLNMCGHYFHRACIDRWLEDHVNCPLCRVNVMPPDINEVD